MTFDPLYRSFAVIKCQQHQHVDSLSLYKIRLFEIRMTMTTLVALRPQRLEDSGGPQKICI